MVIFTFSCRKFWENKIIANLGYAFVNFTTAVGALRFYARYDKSMWKEVTQSTKVCEITCAKIQVIEFLIRFLSGFCFLSSIFLGVLLYSILIFDMGFDVHICRVSRH